MEALGENGYGYRNNKFLVRVLRVWESFSLYSYYTKMLNFIMLDTNNTQNWAIAPLAEREHLLPMICQGFTYYISDFKVVAAQPFWKPIETNLTLVFGKHTKIVDYLFRTSIPRYKFSLCSWPIILSRANNNAVLSGIHFDICLARHWWSYHGCGDIEFKHNDVKSLNLTLLDKRFEISLWGTKATIFKIDFEHYRNKNVILVVTGLLVKKKNGTINLTSTQATSLFFNPKCEEVHNFASYIRSTYGEFICQLPQQAKCTYQYFPEPDNSISYLTLHELLGEPLWVYQKFRCNVTIIDAILRGYHNTDTCFDCKENLLLHEYISCATCGRNFFTPISSPNIVLLVMDQTGLSEFSLKPNEIEQLTGYTKESLLRHRILVNETYTFPIARQIIEGAKCTFEVVLNPSSYSNTFGTIMVENVIKYTKMR